MAEADVYMPLVSSTFLSSDFRIAELGAAYGLRKNILPVLLEGDIKYMPFKFVDFQILDARKMDKFELVSKIIENTTTMHESSK